MAIWGAWRLWIEMLENGQYLGSIEMDPVISKPSHKGTNLDRAQ